MLIFSGILTFIHVIICVLLVIAILLQSSKGGGLAGTFGGQSSSTALFGTRGTASALATVTKYLAAAFLALSLTLSLMAGGSRVTESVTQKVLQQTPASQLPAVEDLEFGTTPVQGTEVETETEEP